MKLNVSITLFLVSSALATRRRADGGDCDDDSPLTDYSTLSQREVGARNTVDWRTWLLRNGSPISFWHDVPLYPDEDDHQVVNMVVEIPRWTNGKIEIHREEPLKNVWPHKSYPFLYGSIPQTWETPNLDHEFTDLPGDNDPVDIFDIGTDPGYIGQIKQVKILGGLALNDGDETDWKVLAIDVNDPLAKLVDSFKDLEKYRPGLTEAYRDWFTYYKVPRGDNLIEISGGTYQDANFIVSMLEESHGWWRELVEGSVDSNEINYNQTTQGSLDSFVSRCDAVEKFDIPKENATELAAGVPAKYSWWYYLDEDFKLIELPGDD